MGVNLLYADEEKAGKLLARLEKLRIPYGRTKPLGVTPRTDEITIVWGQEVSAILAQNEEVWNRPSVARRWGSKAQLADQLHIHGISTGRTRYSKNAEGYYPYQYRVPVFRMEALTLFSGQANAVHRLRMPIGIGGDEDEVRKPYPMPKLGIMSPVFAETGLERQDKRGTLAIREAIKTIYALGLDFGTVDIGFAAEGGPEVMAVMPYPELDDRLADLFADAIRVFNEELEEEQRRVKPAMLGADPEFLLADPQGKIVHASRYLPKNGIAGCDVLTIRGVKRYPLAELRPHPTPDPRKLLRNIRKAMLHAADFIADDKLKWVAGGMPANGFALGGHLHMSGVLLSTRLLRVLDNYLALPLVLAEEIRSARRRPRYGFLGDCRKQKHGGFEYRTLPSWLVAPKLAKGVLASAALIVAHYPWLHRRPLSDTAVQKRYYAGDKKGLLPVVMELWADLERLPGYEDYADWLETYKRTLFSMEAWEEHKDIRPAWKIPHPPELNELRSQEVRALPNGSRQVHDSPIRVIIGTGVTNVAGGGER